MIKNHVVVKMTVRNLLAAAIFKTICFGLKCSSEEIFRLTWCSHYATNVFHLVKFASSSSSKKNAQFLHNLSHYNHFFHYLIIRRTSTLSTYAPYLLVSSFLRFAIHFVVDIR